MKKVHLFIICLSLLAACKKDNTHLNDTSIAIKELPGTLYYKWADEGVLKIDLPTANGSTFLVNDSKRNGWDVSLDNNRVLESWDVPGNSQANLFTIRSVTDGTLLSQFEYYATDGDIATGSLSPNGKMIAIHPTFKDGIVITDLEGNMTDHLNAIGEEKIDKNPVWMPDNTLLFAHNNLLLKTNANFTEVTVIKEFDFLDWGSPAVSRDGKKIAFTASKHIWIMNADGSDMKQITTSNMAETLPQFSPDGKHLLIGTEFHTTGLFGKIFNLKVIPADGQQYQVDEGEESKGVIPIRLPDKLQLEAASSKISWR